MSQINFNDASTEEHHQSPASMEQHPAHTNVFMNSSTNAQPTSGGGHRMAADDPDNPMNWPIQRKLFVSAASFAFGFVVAFGATAYTAAIQDVMAAFNISMMKAILGLSLFLWGIAFSPIHTPHLSERFGRQVVYLVSLPLFALFILGASKSQSFAALAACRFFAGLTGGPCLVLIEGTFADVWSAKVTVTYYVALACSSFIGAASGPLIGGFTQLNANNWRWTQWTTLILTVAAYLLGIGMPETYAREILRRRAKRAGQTITLAPAQSGTTIPAMAKITILTPLKMLVTEPIVILLTLYVGYLFACTFQWFISIPVVLSMTYNFTLQQIGLAFISAIGGSLLAAATATLIDRLAAARFSKAHGTGSVPIEYRMIPGMFGGVLVTTSLFWIAWTATPAMHFLVPIFGTGVYIWGTVLVLTSAISYLFDAYPPAATLSALTAAACFRLVLAGLIPLYIIPMIMGLGGAWAVSTWGFIGAALMFIPGILFFFGENLRGRSVYCDSDMHQGMMKEGKDEEMQ